MKLTMFNGIVLMALAQLVALSLYSCSSVDPKANALALLEIAPLPRAVVVKPVIEYEPVYSVLKIIEVSEVNGVQKYFLTKFGADKTGVSVGVTGDIAEDPEFTKIIGTYKIIEVYKDFFKSQIDMLSYKIGAVAYIRIKTGEKVKEAKQ